MLAQIKIHIHFSQHTLSFKRQRPVNHLADGMYDPAQSLTLISSIFAGCGAIPGSGDIVLRALGCWT